MKTLDQIGIEQQTDKASVFTRTYAKPHDYLRHMEKFFEPMRNEPIKLVEIGVGGGESIKTWFQYFPNAFVVGVDFVKDTNLFNETLGFHDFTFHGTDVVRYHFHAADQTDPVFWKCFAADYGKTIDIAIDDGSHQPKAVQISFAGLWPLIKPGGLYCIEDLGCGFTDTGAPRHEEWLAQIIAPLVVSGLMDIDSIYISRELCIIRKVCTPT